MASDSDFESSVADSVADGASLQSPSLKAGAISYQSAEKSLWQLSVAQIFLLTSACALTIAIYRIAGMYWCLIGLVAVVCLRAPTYDGLNPIVQAIAYAAIVLGLTCGLAYNFDVAPITAIVPCCVMPSLAYLVGFTKAMNN